MDQVAHLHSVASASPSVQLSTNLDKTFLSSSDIVSPQYFDHCPYSLSIRVQTKLNHIQIA